MRRRPNPWIVVPAIALGLLAGALGWAVTDVSCRQSGAGCLGWSVTFALLAFFVVSIGVTVVLVLVYRSLAEWQAKSR